jgi:uncharacterized protein YkwD
LPLSSRRVARTVLTAVVLSLTAGTAANPALARDNDQFLALANDYRAAAGVGQVGAHSLLTQIAVARADQMAAANVMAHDVDYVIDRVEAAGVCWSGVGEIIAYQGGGSEPDVPHYFEMWYASDTHREILLKSTYDVAAGSWSTGSSGRHYAVMLFLNLCSSSSGTTTGGFTDIATSIFKADIVWLADAGITSGCTATRFCPDAHVTRGQMASFLARALRLPTAAHDYFGDDESSIHEADINRVAEAGIATGCASRRFCPGSAVTRAQMASFLNRAFGLAGTRRDYFVDDETSVHEADINRVAASAITTGCSSTRYCPASSVTRGQMAAFLHRAFGK